jgi:hypothetical protein
MIGKGLSSRTKRELLAELTTTHFWVTARCHCRDSGNPDIEFPNTASHQSGEHCSGRRF